MDYLGLVKGYLDQVPTVVRSVDVLRRAGLVPLARPDQALRSVLTVRRYGPIAGAARSPRRATTRRSAWSTSWVR